jgi:hypothetical protein
MATASRNGKHRAQPRGAEFGQVSILALDAVRPSPENDRLYRPVDPADPEVRALAKSVGERGVLEPLVVTADHFILSGHRRHAAARLAGLGEVPCRVLDVCRGDGTGDDFLRLLREYNRQRVKSLDEVVREEVASVNPEEAYRALIEHRDERSRVRCPTLEIEGAKVRAKISKAKQPFLDAVLRVLKERWDFWPLSERQIHYALLNDPPLTHASKPGSRYRNTVQCYKQTCDLVTRARLEGLIDWEAIHDPTRPVVVWNVHRSPAPFVRGQADDFLKGYRRDLQQSQPNHIEIVGEKNTIARIINLVALRYSIPVTIGRGYCSLPPRYKMAQRFKNSGKEKLVILALSDFDPEGEDIAHSFARSMRDDFGIEAIEPVKVALTREQVHALGLPPVMKAKETSSRYAGFVERHGDDVFELEAVSPQQLQDLLHQAIDAVLDVDAFNAEVEEEKRDAARLVGVRHRMKDLADQLGDLEDS